MADRQLQRIPRRGLQLAQPAAPRRGQDVHGGEGGHVLLKLPQAAGTARADNSKKQAEDDHMDEDDKDEDEDEESKLVIEDDV